MTRDEVISYIHAEREAQIAKWGVQQHPNELWFAILAEEFGEVSTCVIDLFRHHDEEEIIDNLKFELTQVAAVAVAWLEALENTPL